MRPVDQLGRVVIPIDFRRALGLGPLTQVEVVFEERGILIRPYRPACRYCGAIENLVEVGHEKVCRTCLAKLAADGAVEVQA